MPSEKLSSSENLSVFYILDMKRIKFSSLLLFKTIKWILKWCQLGRRQNHFSTQDAHKGTTQERDHPSCKQATLDLVLLWNVEFIQVPLLWLHLPNSSSDCDSASQIHEAKREHALVNIPQIASDFHYHFLAWILSSPFYRKANWGPESLSDLPRNTQLISGRSEHWTCIHMIPESRVLQGLWLFLLTAKSLQSCPTLCDPIDGSPPGSPVPGILQARTLERVAISFSNESEKWKWSRSVVSDSSGPHGLQPTRLLHPWDFPGKSTGVGCHCLLRWLFVQLVNLFIFLINFIHDTYS